MPGGRPDRRAVWRSMFHMIGKPKSITPLSSLRHAAGLENCPAIRYEPFSNAADWMNAAMACRLAASPSASNCARSGVSEARQ